MQRMTMRHGAESVNVSVWDAFVLPVLKYRRLTYTVVATATTLALVASLTLKNRYTSTAVILPGGGRTQVSKLSQAVGALAEIGLGTEVGLNENPAALYPEILSSRWMADRMLETRFPEFCDESLQNVTLEDYLDQPTRDRAVRKLRTMVRVDTDRRSGTTRVSVTTTCAELSAAMAQAYVAALDDWNVNQRRSSAGETMDFVSKRLEEKLRDLEIAEENLRAFQAKNRNFATSNDPDILMEQARHTRTVEVQTRLYMALLNEYQQARLEAARDIPVVQVLDRGSVPQEKSAPKRSYYVLGAFFGSLFFSLLLSAWLDLSARRRWGHRLDHLSASDALHLSGVEARMYRAISGFGGRLQSLADTPPSPGHGEDVAATSGMDKAEE